MVTRIIDQLLNASPKSVLLLGPRQVGKSTLISTLKPDLTINLAHEKEFLDFSTSPSELEQRLAKNYRTIFIDEIQRIPSLLNTIQVLIDQNKSLKFYLSGSSARKLRRGSANLLPGRIFTYRLGPLSYQEIGVNIDDKKILSLGSLPEPYLLLSPQNAQKHLDSYAGTYLKEEIQQESMTRNIQGFSRFLKTCALNSGLFLDFSKLSTKSKISRSAARRFYEILEDTLICERVEVCTLVKDEVDTVKHPKFYFFDTGVINALIGNFEPSPDRQGFLFENLFFNQIKNTAFALDAQNLNVSHLRTRGGAEIDFVVEYKNRVIAVETKLSAPHRSEIKNLLQAETYFDRPIEKYVACLERTSKTIEGVTVKHWTDVLDEIFKERPKKI